MKRLICASALLLGVLGCIDEGKPSSDQIQASQQEKILQEGTRAVGMPAITNFRERRLMKTILEMRDQELTTYTYTYSERTGKARFFCNSIGFAIPYATQYTNPSKMSYEWHAHGGSAGGHFAENVLPQADPNGLYSPSSAEGSWVMCKNPSGPDVAPIYIEPRVIVSPFPLAKTVLEEDSAVDSGEKAK